MDNVTLPYIDSPMFNLAMRDLIICLSSFTPQEKVSVIVGLPLVGFTHFSIKNETDRLCTHCFYVKRKNPLSYRGWQFINIIASSVSSCTNEQTYSWLYLKRLSVGLILDCLLSHLTQGPIGYISSTVLVGINEGIWDLTHRYWIGKCTTCTLRIYVFNGLCSILTNQLSYFCV